MDYLIGKTLQFAKKELADKGIAYQVVENSDSIEGDTILVTNAQNKNGIVILTTSKFIFNLKDISCV